MQFHVPIKQILDKYQGPGETVNGAECWSCLWCDHHKPSLLILPAEGKYEKEKAFCRSCGSTGDVADVYMKLTGCGFKTAKFQLGQVKDKMDELAEWIQEVGSKTDRELFRAGWGKNMKQVRNLMWKADSWGLLYCQWFTTNGYHGVIARESAPDIPRPKPYTGPWSSQSVNQRVKRSISDFIRRFNAGAA